MTNDNKNELVFLPLGGVGEIGMNCALYGYGPPRTRQWLMVDLGVAFAGDDLHEDAVEPAVPAVDRLVVDVGDLVAGLQAGLGTRAVRDHLGDDLGGGDLGGH